MRLRISRHSIEIIPDVCLENESDIAFIEEVLGLKKAGDWCQLIRVNAIGLGCIAYLKAEKRVVVDISCKHESTYVSDDMLRCCYCNKVMNDPSKSAEINGG